MPAKARRFTAMLPGWKIDSCARRSESPMSVSVGVLGAEVPSTDARWEPSPAADISAHHTASRPSPGTDASSAKSEEPAQFPIVVHSHMEINARRQQACVPAAVLTSARLRPPTRAWLINVWRPWWIVRVRKRARPSTLQADRNRRRRAARRSGKPRRCACTEQTNGSRVGPREIPELERIAWMLSRT
jgi:hypothetical protein